LYFIFPFFDLLCFIHLLFVIHQRLRERFVFTGKHKGHTVSNIKEAISDLRTTFKQEMRTKLDVIQKIQKQTETGLTTFDLELLFVIHQRLRERFVFISCFLPQCCDHLFNMAVNHCFYFCAVGGLQTAVG
jgi:hypothetical protein